VLDLLVGELGQGIPRKAVIQELLLVPIQLLLLLVRMWLLPELLWILLLLLWVEVHLRELLLHHLLLHRRLLVLFDISYGLLEARVLHLPLLLLDTFLLLAPLLLIYLLLQLVPEHLGLVLLVEGCLVLLVEFLAKFVEEGVLRLLVEVRNPVIPMHLLASDYLDLGQRKRRRGCYLWCVHLWLN
jgi:hypothetical protein